MINSKARGLWWFEALHIYCVGFLVLNHHCFALNMNSYDWDSTIFELIIRELFIDPNWLYQWNVFIFSTNPNTLWAKHAFMLLSLFKKFQIISIYTLDFSLFILSSVAFLLFVCLLIIVFVNRPTCSLQYRYCNYSLFLLLLDRAHEICFC